MTLKELRYYFEHQLLPRYFFEHTAGFLDEISAPLIKEEENPNAVSGDNIYSLFSEIAEKYDVAHKYTKEQFELDIYPIGELGFMFKISLPEPEDTILCSHIYLVLSEDFTYKRYFTIELLEIKRKRKYYCLCEWTSDSHENYGEISNNSEERENMIVKLFLQEIP